VATVFVRASAGKVGVVHVIHVVQGCRMISKERPQSRFAELPHMCADR
jgi:hypothetical protein